MANQRFPPHRMSTFHTDDLLSLRELGQEDHNPSTDPDSTMVEQTAEGPSFEMFPETFPSGELNLMALVANFLLYLCLLTFPRC